MSTMVYLTFGSWFTLRVIPGKVNALMAQKVKLTGSLKVKFFFCRPIDLPPMVYPSFGSWITPSVVTGKVKPFFRKKGKIDQFIKCST